MQKNGFDFPPRVGYDSSMVRSKTCCFTGHRPQKLPWGFNENDPRFLAMKERLRSAIVEAIEDGYTYFVSGMALGFDMVAAELVLELRKQYPGISLECALACEGQEKVWLPKTKLRFTRVIMQASNVTYFTKEFTRTCMDERNLLMVNKSSLIITLYDGKPGGTKKTLDVARAMGSRVVNVF